MLKLIPGFGAVVGGSDTGAVAAGFTAATGAAWTAVCVQLAEGKLSTIDGAMDNAAIREVFLDGLKREIEKRNPRFK